jgi:hypothetical protein
MDYYWALLTFEALWRRHHATPEMYPRMVLLAPCNTISGPRYVFVEDTTDYWMYLYLIGIC